LLIENEEGMREAEQEETNSGEVQQRNNRSKPGGKGTSSDKRNTLAGGNKARKG
jgi:hypothetical protein